MGCCTTCCRLSTEWTLKNALYIKIVAVLIVATGIAFTVCGIVMCRGNTVQIYVGDSVTQIYK